MTEPAPVCTHAEKVLLRLTHAPCSEPGTHTAVMVLSCALCGTACFFPEANAAMMDPIFLHALTVVVQACGLTWRHDPHGPLADERL